MEIREKKNLREIGDSGEETARKFLVRKGFEIVVANFKTPIGRNRKGVLVSGEIDLIALDGEIICFVEVKTRANEHEFSAISAVDLRKQRQITRTAKAYREIFALDNPIRFDVVGVVPSETNAPKITYFPGFWTEEKFKKRKTKEY